MTPKEMKDAADAIADTARQAMVELGIDPSLPEVVRACQRAVLIVRERQGYEEGVADEAVGPPLSRSEKWRVLTNATLRVDP